MSHEHRADGRLRLAAALSISLAAAFTQSAITLTLMLGLALAAAVLVDRQVLRRLFTANVIVLAIWLTVPFDWRSLNWREEGLALATLMSLRVNVIVLSAGLLLARMNGIEFARAAVALGLPNSLGLLLALAVRQIALLAEMRARLEIAMRARGYRARLGWRTLRVSAQWVAWLLVHALVRAERQDLGLRARGLTAASWSTRRPSPWGALPRREWQLFALVAAAIVVTLALPYGWN